MTDEDIDEIVSELKAVNATVTRAHYLLDERLLDRFDEEGILVWSQAPVYHRDVQLRTPAGPRLRARHGPPHRPRGAPASLGHHALGGQRALAPARRQPGDQTVPRRGARAHRRPRPDAARLGRRPGLAGLPPPATYAKFDLLGLNAYFGWYDGSPSRSTAELSSLEPFLRATHRTYPRQALVMTEFGASRRWRARRRQGDVRLPGALPAPLPQRHRPPGLHERRDLLDAARVRGQAQWDGGAQRTDVERDSIHNKGLIHYQSGERKPAFDVAASSFGRTPLYRSEQPRAFAPALAEPPRAASAGFGGTAILVGALGLLGVIAAMLAFLLRDIWRFGGRPTSGPATSTVLRPTARRGAHDRADDGSLRPVPDAYGVLDVMTSPSRIT
jgi:beta-glucuronidase